MKKHALIMFYFEKKKPSKLVLKTQKKFLELKVEKLSQKTFYFLLL